MIIVIVIGHVTSLDLSMLRCVTESGGIIVPSFEEEMHVKIQEHAIELHKIEVKKAYFDFERKINYEYPADENILIHYKTNLPEIRNKGPSYD